MNILNQYKKIKQNIENYSFNIPTNLIVVTKGRSLADIQKIINLGWRPTISLDQGIKLTVEWYLKNK